MPVAPPPVRPVTVDEIRAARERIKNTILRTPLVKLRHDAAAPEIWLKLENLQPINAFKLRGAANAVGIPATVVTIDTAPETKVERMRNLGARIVKAPFDACWQAMELREFPGVEGTFIHPFDDHDFIAGNATLGMEIVEDLPNVKTVIAAIGGGGLISGIGSAVRQLAPQVRILGAEPETAAPGALSFEKNSPQEFTAWQASFVDGAGGKSIFPRMWERMQGIVDGSIVVTLDEVRRAMRLVAEKVRVIAEGAGALAVAAALSGKAGDGPIVAVISGGNIDLKKFAELVAST